MSSSSHSGSAQVGGLVEVVGEESLGDLLVFPAAGLHGELGLGRSPCGMGEWGRSGLADMGEDPCDGLWVIEECDESVGCLADWADEGEDLIDAGQ